MAKKFNINESGQPWKVEINFLNRYQDTSGLPACLGLAERNQGTQPENLGKIPPPRAHSPPGDVYIDYSDSQIPPWDDNYSDPDYPFEAYM